jgi:uncharacterized membrane protein YagU involved in acid resistance
LIHIHRDIIYMESTCLHTYKQYGLLGGTSKIPKQSFLTALLLFSTTLVCNHPTQFISDGTVCLVCQNGFGLKEEMALGSCQYIYHPMCLISIFLVHRFCALCQSPFYERLHELFGFICYMPPNWKKDPINTPGESMAMH